MNFEVRDVAHPYPEAQPVATEEWDYLDRHEHTVRFYEDDAFLLDQLSRFVGGALGEGAAAVVIATEAHREGLVARLEAQGVDTALVAAQGRFVALDASEVLGRFMRDEMPDARLFHDVVGKLVQQVAAARMNNTGGIAAFGEMVSVLWAEGKVEAALRLEHLWNDLAKIYSFDLHCAYPMSLFRQSTDGEAMDRICAAHSHVVPAESYTAIAGSDGRMRAIAGLQQKARALETEIEEHKRVADALRLREIELTGALAARDEFLTAAAHELKTPITSLRGFAQLLLRDTRRHRDIPPHRLEMALTAIDRQTGKLTQLITRLLDSTQIEAGKLRIERVPADLVRLVRGQMLDQDCATCTLIFEGPDTLIAEVDPLRFEQVVANLLDNAIKFSPPDGRVTVALGHTAGGNIRLSVTDQGAGIPLGERFSVFSRFHQARDASHLSGLGLGLYIVREIVELHGGSVHIEEPEQQGARLVVTLPAHSILPD